MALPHCYAFAAFDIATKMAWIRDKPGAEAMRQTSEGLCALVDDMATTKHVLDRGMADLGIAWQGPAAQAAQESLDRTATGVDGTATVARNGADRMVDHGNAFERMRAEVRFVDPAESSWLQRVSDNVIEAWHSVWGDGTDHVTIAERNQANDEAANRALRMYASETSAIDDRFTTAAAAAPPPGAKPGSPAGGGAPPGGAVVIPDGEGGGFPGVSPGPVASAGSQVGGTTPPPPSSPGPTAGIGAGGRVGDGTAGGAFPFAPAPSRPTTPSGTSGSDDGSGRAPDRSLRVPPVTERPVSPSLVPPPGLTREDLARRFGDRVNRQQLLGGGTGTGAYRGGERGAGTGDGRGFGSPSGGGRSGARLWGGSTDLHAPAARGGPGTAWGTEPRTSSSRGSASEAWTRPAEQSPRGQSGGYGPMAGGVPGGRGEGRDHRNRYVVPTDEVSDVGITATDAVLAPEDPGR